jgi:hypothetical protein
MIQDGAGRTGSRDGLAGFLNKPNAADISPYTKAARVYSSCSTPRRGDLGVVLRIGHGEQVGGLQCSGTHRLRPGMERGKSFVFISLM